MNREMLAKPAADYYRLLMAGVTGGFVVSIGDLSFPQFMAGSIMIVLLVFLCYYEITRVEEKFGKLVSANFI